MKKISVVVSCFNEEAVLGQFYGVTAQVLENCRWDYELIFVNDGSRDSSLSILRDIARENEKVKVISFSRNFGHEAAMIAGIDYATGDGIICMDADLQHPPQCIPEILAKFDEGMDVVSMVRTRNDGAGLWKKLTSGAFYKLLNRLSSVQFQENASDFFGVSARAADVLRRDYRERVRYLRGYVQSIGYRCCALPFAAAQRAGGKSHYSMVKLVRFSITALCGYSDVPLKLGIYAGFLAALCGVILLIYSLVMKIHFGAPSGYTTIVVALCFLFSLTLLVIGMIGEYLSVVLREVKGRPIYIVEELVNLEEPREEQRT